MHSRIRWTSLGIVAIGLFVSVASALPGEGNPPALDDRPATLLGMDRALLGVELTRDGKSVITCSRNGTTRFFDADSGRERYSFRDRELGLWPMRSSADGMSHRFATGGPGVFIDYTGISFGKTPPRQFGCAVRLWDSSNGRMIRELSLGDKEFFQQLALSLDGRRIACSDQALNLKLWDAETGQELASIPGPKERAAGAVGYMSAFSDDATRYATRMAKATGLRPFVLYLADLSTGKTRTIEAPGPGLDFDAAVSIGRDGREVAALTYASWPVRDLTIFDFGSGAVLARFRQPITGEVRNYPTTCGTPLA
jgi:hypothetical protein